MNRDRYVLAIDQGTTGTTALLVGENGRIAASGYHEICQFYPEPGHVEHNPKELITSSISAACEAISKAKISISQITGLGITNQRETTLVWDKISGQPVNNAIVWQCRRTAPICEILKDRGMENAVRRKTGLPIDAYFSGTKIKWILDNIKDGQKRARDGELLFGTVDSWLAWNLSGGKLHVTDYTNASRTMLFDINTLDWDDELLSMLDIPRTILPEVLPSSHHYGETLPNLFGEGVINLAAIAGDQQAALFGEACFEPGMAKNTYGTGSFVMLNTGQKPVFSKSGMISTIAWLMEDKICYALEGSIFNSGTAIQWLRDGLGIISKPADTEVLANSVSDCGGVYFVPAFTGLGAPYWDMYARGAIFGLTRGSTKGHLARAALEAIAFQVKDVVTAMEQDTASKVKLLRVDGGGATNRFLMKFQSDILNIPVQKTQITEITALGIAYMAGLKVGLWADLPQIAHVWAPAETFEPSMDNETRERLYSGWKRAVQQTSDRINR